MYDTMSLDDTLTIEPGACPVCGRPLDPEATVCLIYPGPLVFCGIECAEA